MSAFPIVHPLSGAADTLPNLVASLPNLVASLPEAVASLPEAVASLEQPAKRRGRKPKVTTQLMPHSDMLQKQSVKPQENVVLYLKTTLTAAQKHKIKEYDPGFK